MHLHPHWTHNPAALPLFKIHSQPEWARKADAWLERTHLSLIELIKIYLGLDNHVFKLHFVRIASHKMDLKFKRDQASRKMIQVVNWSEG